MTSSKKLHDATRQERKAKKRKLEDAVPDLPGDAAAAEETDRKKGKKRKRDADAQDVVVDDDENERKGGKAERKRRRKEAVDEGGGAIEVEVEGKVEKKERKSKKDWKEIKPVSTTVEPELQTETIGEVADLKKSKKERKAKRRAETTAKGKDAVIAEEESKSKSTAKGETNGNQKAEDTEAEKKSKKNNRNREKKRKAGGVATSEEGRAILDGNGVTDENSRDKKKDARFICFIGNLPFTANTQSISKHFAPVKPISVRALTHRDDPTKSKGIAFLEFDGYDHMKTCLKMFHHSMFDDGLSAPRKINVELSAGGGGNTKNRRAKIQGKNAKLNEQRARRMQEEAKIKLEKSSNAAAIDESAIHPSRRTRVPGV